jgi:hypothetical protein
MFIKPLQHGDITKNIRGSLVLPIWNSKKKKNTLSRKKEKSSIQQTPPMFG